MKRKLSKNDKLIRYSETQEYWRSTNQKRLKGRINQFEEGWIAKQDPLPYSTNKIKHK